MILFFRDASSIDRDANGDIFSAFVFAFGNLRERRGGLVVGIERQRGGVFGFEVFVFVFEVDPVASAADFFAAFVAPFAAAATVVVVVGFFGMGFSADAVPDFVIVGVDDGV